MEACWHQNRIKINFLSEKAKSPLALEIPLFFNRISFPGTEKKIQNRSKILPKLKSRWEGLLTRIFPPFTCLFGPKTVQTYPKWLPKDAKMAPETLPRRFRDLQEAPKIPPRPSKMPSRRPKTSPRRSKRPSRAVNTANMTGK